MRHQMTHHHTLNSIVASRIVQNGSYRVRQCHDLQFILINTLLCRDARRFQGRMIARDGIIR